MKRRRKPKTQRALARMQGLITLHQLAANLQMSKCQDLNKKVSGKLSRICSDEEALVRSGRRRLRPRTDDIIRCRPGHVAAGRWSWLRRRYAQTAGHRGHWCVVHISVAFPIATPAVFYLMLRLRERLCDAKQYLNWACSAAACNSAFQSCASAKNSETSEMSRMRSMSAQRVCSRSGVSLVRKAVCSTCPGDHRAVGKLAPWRCPVSALARRP